MVTQSSNFAVRQRGLAARSDTHHPGRLSSLFLSLQDLYLSHELLIRRVLLGATIGMVSLAVLVRYWGIGVPYVNLHLGKIQFFLSIGALLFLGSSHLLWRRFVWGCSLLGWCVFYFAQLRFGSVWGILVVLFFPYRYLFSLVRRREDLVDALRSMYRDRFSVLLTILVTITTVFAYWGMWNLYFEGDEWYLLRTYIPAMQRYPIVIAGFIQSLVSPSEYGFHQSYLVNTLYPIVFWLFGLRAWAHLALSLVLHLVNAVLVGLLAQQLIGKKSVAIATALGFATLASHSQAVTWIAATLNTQLAVMFGVMALRASIALQEGGVQRIWPMTTLLLLALWSKETALVFVMAIVCYSLLFVAGRRRLLKAALLAFVVFLLSRQLPSLFVNTPSPLALASKLATPEQQGLFGFRLWLFPLKMFSQALIPQEVLIQWSVWLTDMQFPYFLEQKAIRGSTYVNTIQTLVPELLSYAFSIGLGLFFAGLVALRNRRLSAFLLIVYVMGCVPIVLLTLMFPWWGTASLVDSRHFYHLSWAIVLLVSYGVYELLQRTALPKKDYVFYLVIGSLVIWQATLIRDRIETMLPTAADRHMIVSRITQAVKETPSTLVLYTTSNKSYYGFAEYMLPFQTSVAQMLPALFSRQLHPSGMDYPDDFYSSRFFSRGGLVAQGIETSEGRRLGYFLDRKMLQKAIVEHQVDPEQIYSFRYNGDTNELEDISEAIREELGRFLQSRVAIADWTAKNFTDQRLRFSVHPSWNVSVESHKIIITDQRTEPLFVIEVADPQGRTHSQFVLEYGPLEAMKTSVRDFDFDTQRIEYYFDKDKNLRRFLLAGNNMKFYVITPRQDANVDEFFRTFEFWDDGNDAYLFAPNTL